MADNDRNEILTFTEDEWTFVDKVLFAPEILEGTVEDRDATDGARWLLLYMQNNDEQKVLSAVRIGTSGDVKSFGIDPIKKEIHHVDSPSGGSFFDRARAADFQVETGMTLPVGQDLQPIKEFLLELQQEHTDFTAWEKGL